MFSCCVLYLNYLFIFFSCITLVHIDKALATPAQTGITTVPAAVTVIVRVVDAAPILTFVSTDTSIVKRAS